MRRDKALAAGGLEARIRRQNAQIAKLRALVASYDGAQWKKVSEQIEVRLRRTEREREDNFLKLSEVELKVAIAREVEMKELMALPRTAQWLLAKTAEENAAAKEQLRKIKQRMTL